MVAGFSSIKFKKKPLNLADAAPSTSILEPALIDPATSMEPPKAALPAVLSVDAVAAPVSASVVPVAAPRTSSVPDNCAVVPEIELISQQLPDVL